MGCFMLVMSPPAHNNILLGTVPHCSLFWCDFRSNVVTPGMAVPRSTGEHAPATLMSRSTRWEIFIHLKYMRASFTSPKILWMTILCQGIGSLNPFQSLLRSFLLVLHVARLHRLV